MKENATPYRFPILIFKELSKTVQESMRFENREFVLTGSPLQFICFLF